MTPLPEAPRNELPADDPPATASPLRVADYELLEPIARGGMGSVWRARQLSAGRIVAYKTVAGGLLASSAERRRFRTEIEAAALLDHPHIVPIYDVGDDDGRPFFTMRLMEGGTLTQQIAHRPSPISPREAAALLVKVARAVHFAHERGILHRDLKPGNILLDAVGEPYVADFGLARCLELDSSLTLSGDVLGTPAYLAPEVAAGGSRQATVAADVYSLGAILYELLAGRPPFQADTVPALLRKITEEEPMPLRQLRRQGTATTPHSESPASTDANQPAADRAARSASIRPSAFGLLSHSAPRTSDLETICLKCLAKPPAARYPSAAALADDLERWLRGEPIRARPTTLLELGVKWAKRKPAHAGLLAVAAVLPALIIAGLLWANAHIRREREQTRLNLYAADMALADRARREGNLGLARATLAAYIPATGAASGTEDFRGFEWRWLWQQSQGDQRRILTGFPRPPTAVAVSPDGRTLAIAGQEFLWRWNLEETNGVELLPPKEARWLEPELAARLLAKVHASPFLANQLAQEPTPGNVATWVNPEAIGDVTGLSFSPDGRSILSSAREGLRAARVWSIADGAVEFAFPATFQHAVFAPAKPVVAVGSLARPSGPSIGSLKLYDLDQCAEIWALPDAGGLSALSAQGELLVTAGASPKGGSRIALWSVAERRLRREFATRWACVTLALSPDGGWIAAAHADSSTIELWSVAGGTTARELPGHAGAIHTLAFSPDNLRLASAGADQLARLWSVPTGELAVTLRGHTDAITSLAFLPDAQTLVTASRDGTVRLWPTAPAAVESRGFYANPETRLLFSSDGRQWAAALRDEAPLRVWDTGAGLARREFNRSGQHVQTEGFDDLAQAVVRSLRALDSGQIQLEWRSSASGELRRTVVLEGAFGQPYAHALQPAMNLIALGQTNGRIRVWDTRRGALVRTFVLPDPVDPTLALGLAVQQLALSPDGAFLAAGVPSHSRIAVFSVPENRLLYRLQVQPLFKVFDHLADSGRLRWLEFSPDSQRLATTDATETGIRLWDARTGRPAGRLAGHRDSTVQVAFSPDGRTLASTGADGSLKLWHLPTRREVATLLESGAKGPLGFSPDGTLLLAALRSDQVRAFRALSVVGLDTADASQP